MYRLPIKTIISLLENLSGSEAQKQPCQRPSHTGMVGEGDTSPRSELGSEAVGCARGVKATHSTDRSGNMTTGTVVQVTTYACVWSALKSE